MTAILRLQLDDKDPVRVNSAINQLAEYSDRNTRTRLTANTTLYVSPSGSDSNSGSQASPFLTIQHAYDVITNTLDLGGQSVTIQCASGTYTTGLIISQPWTGGGNVTLDLGGGTISSTGDCFFSTNTIPGTFTFRNGTLSSSSAVCINHAAIGNIIVDTGMTFGSGSHMSATGAGAIITCNNSFTISGSGFSHYGAVSGGIIIGRGGTTTITGTTGTPAFSVFAYASRIGSIDVEGRIYSGSATGQRYFADSNAVIFTNGGGANYFPGTTPGSPTPGVIGPSGGIYV